MPLKSTLAFQALEQKLAVKVKETEHTVEKLQTCIASITDTLNTVPEIERHLDDLARETQETRQATKNAEEKLRVKREEVNQLMKGSSVIEK
jgi:hypothetical protein